MPIPRVFRCASAVLLAWVLLAPLAAHAAPAPCTHRLGPAEQGVQAWLAAATPGQVLCLAPGTYTGAANMLSVPAGRHGTAASPITVRAETEGTVLLDGEDSRRPLHLGADAWRVWGIDVTRGDNHNVRVSGNGNLVQNLISLDVGKDGDGAISVGGQYNVIEDCAAAGPARKQLLIGAAHSGPGYNTIRRCIGLWRSNPHLTSNPTNAGELGYGQDDGTFENVILAWNMLQGGRSTEPEGVMQLFGTRRSRVLGSLFLVTPDAAFQPARLVAAYNDAGSHVQQGQYHNTTDLLWQHTVAYVSPQHPRFGDLRAYAFQESSTSAVPAGQRNVIRAIVGVAGQPNQFSTRSWLPPEQVQWGRSMAEAIGEGKSVWTDSVAAAGICRQYVDGVLTATPLWPWPMQARILARTGADVMQLLEGLLGPIPAACRRDTPGTPEPPIPGALVLQCAGEVTQVPGPVSLRCEQATRREAR